MEALFEIAAAWNALMYLLAGFVTAGIGIALFAFTIAIAIRAKSFDGEIIAVRAEQKRRMYWPVVAYADAQGRYREANANAGTNSILANLPGRKVTVLTAGWLKESVLLVRDWWVLFALAACLVLFAIPFLSAGVSDLHFNARTAMVALALAAAIGFKLYKAIRKLAGASDLAAAREAFAARRQARASMTRLSDTDIAEAVATERKQSAYAGPMTALIGAAALAGGLYWYQSASEFERTAFTAEGTVLRNEIASGSEGTPMHHAIVRFTAADGTAIEHRDGTGTSWESYHPGDRVKILYAPANPKSAKIAGGLLSNLWPLLLIATGLFFLAIGLKTFTASRR